jgi:hypothetical protein
MTKHSPEPWEFVRMGHGVVAVWDAKDVVIHSHANARKNSKEEANAKLVAAAPDLLRACESLLALPAIEVWRDYLRRGIGTATSDGKAVQAALNAIAKALGETQEVGT